MNFASLIEHLLSEGAEEAWGLDFAWINTRTGEVVGVSGSTHFSVMAKDPHRFGVTLVGGEESDGAKFDALFDQAYENGWMRFRGVDEHLYFQGPQTQDAKDTILEICAAVLRENPRNVTYPVVIDWSTGGSRETTVGQIMRAAA